MFALQQRSRKFCANEFKITGNVTNLTEIGRVGPITAIWKVIIEKTTQLRSLAGLDKVTTEGRLAVIKNPKLGVLRGLGRLVYLRELEVKENPSLRSLDGLQSLIMVRQDAIITANDLQSLSGLHSLRVVGGVLNLYKEPSLPSLAGLRSLSEVWGGVKLDNNPGLKTLQGLNRLRIARNISILRSGPLDVLGGLLSDSSVTIIGRLHLDNGSWPSCMAQQELLFLNDLKEKGFVNELVFGKPHEAGLNELVGETGLNELVEEASLEQRSQASLERPIQASLELWRKHACGPEALQCWKGLPCRPDLSGSNLTGAEKVFLTNRSCGSCEGKTTATADLTNLTRELWVGDYTVCRCSSDHGVVGPVAQLSFAGPRLDQEFVCIRGQECILHIRDHDLKVSEVAVKGKCGGNETALFQAVKARELLEYRVDNRSALASADPKRYRLCWKPNCSGMKVSACPELDIGYLRVRGAYVRDEEPVAADADLVVENRGDGVDENDRLRLLPQCGKPGSGELGPVNVSRANVSGASMLFKLKLDPSRVRPRRYHKCWCQPSATNCSAPEHFLATSGTVQVHCPAGYEARGGECRRCDVGWTTEAAGLGRCTLEPGYITVLTSYGVILCLAIYVVLIAIARPALIEDVSTVGGRTIVKTTHPHRWYMHGRTSFAIRFRGTEHPDLDKPGEPMRACVSSSQTLEVLDLKGCPVTKRLDTSRGFVALPQRGALFHRGWPLPPVLSAPLLVLLALLLFLIRTPSLQDLALSTGLAAVVAVTGRLIAAFWPKASTLSKRIEEFRVIVNRTNPRPVACERGPQRAVQLGELFRVLEFFQAFICDRSAYYMDGNIFRPLTSPKRLSYAELIGPRKVEWFVSHFWGGQFHHFCQALQKHAEGVRGPDGWRQATYWVCFLANNQYRLKEELAGGAVLDSSFFVALQSSSCRGVCMVLDDAALPLTRAWCIFELLQTFRLERSSHDGFRGLLLCTAGGVLNLGQGSVEVAMKLAERIGTLDLENAQASDEHDKEMINAEVIKKLGSFEAMNQLVRQKMHDILLKAREHANDSFVHLFVLLSPPGSPNTQVGGEGAADDEGGMEGTGSNTFSPMGAVNL